MALPASLALHSCRSGALTVPIPKIPRPIRRVRSYLCRLCPESLRDHTFPEVAHRPASAVKSPAGFVPPLEALTSVSCL